MSQILSLGASVSCMLPIGATLNVTGVGVVHIAEPGRVERELVMTGGVQPFGPYTAPVRFDLRGGAGGLTFEVIAGPSAGAAGAAGGVVYVTGVSGVGNVATARLATGWSATGWQWYRVSPTGVVTAIAGATSSTYTQQAADVVPGTTIYPQASGLAYAPPGLVADGSVPSALAISGTPLTSATVGVAYAFNLAASGGTAPYVFSVAAGALPAGISLNASTGDVAGTPTVPSTSGGIVLRVSDAAGATADLAAFSIVVAAAGTAPVNTALPVVTGTPTEGQLLTASTGSWTGSPTTYTRQWLRGGVAIAGATGATYTLVTADVGAAVSCTVTASNAGGSASATSAGVGPVAAAPVAAPTNTALPAITGTAQVGQVLTVSTGTWTGSPTSYTRQWLRGGVAISGATGSTYTLVTADLGATISCTVTATNAGGSASATSASTAAVAAAALDTRPRVFVAPATAHTTGTQGFLSGATPLTGSANGGAAGTFSLTTTSGNYGWLAVLASASTTGVHVFDGLGFGGWSGAGLAGNNTGASPDPSTSAVTFTDANGTAWRLFRQDYINSNPTAASYTLSAV